MEERLDIQALQQDQVLARDVRAPDGTLLAQQGTVLTDALIGRFAELGIESAWVETGGARGETRSGTAIRTRPADGSFRFVRKKDALFITVLPPKAGGAPVDAERVRAEAQQENLSHVDWEVCERAVREARGVPIDVTARDGTFLLELDDAGLSLTVSHPLSGGRKVGLFQVRKEIELRGYRWIDDAHVQRVVSAATGRKEKIGEKNGTVRIQVSPDRMSAEMTVAGPNGGAPPNEEEANRALHHAKVTHGILPPEVEAALQPENWGKPFTVARGDSVVEGAPARILERYKESGTARSLAERFGCTILEPHTIVEKGEVLVEKTPAVPGKDGVDVSGAARRHRSAMDRELPRGGANVERSADGLLLTAAARGVPSFEGIVLFVAPLESVRVEAPDEGRALEAGSGILGLPREAIGHEVQRGGSPCLARLFRKTERRKGTAVIPASAPSKVAAEPAKVIEPADERPARTVEIASDRNAHREIALHTDTDRLHLFLTVRQRSDPAAVQPAEVAALMERAGIILPEEDAARAAEFLATLSEGPAEVRWKRLASGRPPQPGSDAPVNWAVRIEDDRPGEEDQTNYYQVTRFANVRQGDVLFTLGEPGSGADGLDVYGNVIPASSGAAVPIQAGENARFAEDGKTCIADGDGTVLVKNGVASVHSIHRVRGDVDFHVGNIDFNGVVEVGGNILDEFKVKAAADLLVGGNIEGAEVEVGRNLRVRHGITGHEKGRIRVHGNVEAKYLNGARLIVDGDVTVRAQILNSTVVCRGRVVVQQGGILGGFTAGLLGVSSPVLGSEVGVKTEVAAGVDLVGSVLLEEIEKALADLDARIARVESAVLPFLERPELLDDLSEEKREAARKLLVRLGTMKGQREALEAERDRLAVSPAEQNRAVIAVSKRAFHNVDLRVGPACRKRLEIETSGPVKFRPNPETGELETFRA
ncbi:MAG: DUF342 domain-containing protein [Planctomycetes bacterium]|nr:DUF342 domain-containing protein [Planctomycetota bacterium]